MKRIVLALVLILPVTMASCAPATVSTPAPPNSPQTQALNLTKTLSDAINAAVKTGISLRDQGKFSQANNLILQNWAKSAVALDDRIATELGNGTAWTVQRGHVLALLPGFQIPAMGGLDPTLQAALTLVTQLVGQIQAQVTV
jgi:hypothetical protein